MRFALGHARLHPPSLFVKAKAEQSLYPIFARGVRMHSDSVTRAPVLLYPEGVLPLDEPPFAILCLCSGERTIANLVSVLAKEYDADENTLREQVTECLQQLQDKLLISFATAPHSARSVDAPRNQRKGGASKPAFKYRPYLLLAELTYRCPLHCPYCSNPSVYPKGGELSTADWQRVLQEAAALGVLHVGFSGGEPLQRPDLTQLVAAAREAGLYSNLITSSIGLTRQRAAELKR